MVKTDPSKRRKRQRKVVSSDAVEEDNANTDGQTETGSTDAEKVEQEAAATTESTDVKLVEEEKRDEQDSQGDTVIEVKGNKSSVTVSWDKGEEGEATDGNMETNMNLTVGQKHKTLKDKVVKGKRKAPSTAETSPPKKTKLINDGFCLFVGNLNNSKPCEEVKNALGNYFIAQSLLVQDIRLDRSKKHAYVDLASAMDLTKALTLNGQEILDKPMKLEKAKVKSETKVKVKAPAKDKRVKDARTLFLKNIPVNATKEDILKVFHNAVNVRFPGGTESPNKGFAFVEFRDRNIAKKVYQKKQVAMIQDQVLTVDFVRNSRVGNVDQISKVNDDNNNNEAAAPPKDTLFLGNLSYNVGKKDLKKVFEKAVDINIPLNQGKRRGFAFIKFATVAEAEKALKSSQNMKFGKKEVRVQFQKMEAKPDQTEVLSKTLIVMGLSEKTSAEMLKNAFEGALSARVILDKETGASKRFGFVEFESEENCKAVKESMEDCEIDGSKVTVAYAKARSEQGAKGCPAGRPAGEPADQKAARHRKGRGQKADELQNDAE